MKQRLWDAAYATCIRSLMVEHSYLGLTWREAHGHAVRYADRLVEGIGPAMIFDGG